MPLRILLESAKRETYLALSMFGMAIMLALAMFFQVAYSYAQDPPAFPARDELSGIDPAGVLIMREKAKVADLERRLAIVERLNAVQIRQIDELQRVTFRIGAIGAIGSAGAVIEPTQTPKELSGESVLDKETPQLNQDLP